MAYKRLITLTNEVEASMLVNILESSGMKVIVSNIHFSRLYPHYYNILGSGVNVFVDENDYEDASEYISKEYYTKNKCCPNCESTSLKIKGLPATKNKLLLFFAIFNSIPFNNINSEYVCQNCGYRFK